VQRKWTSPDALRLTPMKSKLAACFSILLWTCIGIAGKGIPYV
jgi:hypothetical protein